MECRTGCQVETNDRLEKWTKKWDEGDIVFHRTDVNPVLSKHLDKLIPDGQPNNFFFPLCGKAVDMKWLADKGFTVTGVEGVRKAVEQFFTENGIERIESDASPQMGAKAKLLSSKDGTVKLYCCDIMNFTGQEEKKSLEKHINDHFWFLMKAASSYEMLIDVEQTFDALWDRGSLVALNREDVPRYVQVVKKLMKPGGRMLVEVVEYDVAIMNDVEAKDKPPPPFPMYEEELKTLYGPEFTVELVDQDPRVLLGKDLLASVYLMVKTSS